MYIIFMLLLQCHMSREKKLTVSYIFALRWEKAIQKYSTLLYKNIMPHLLRWRKHRFQSISYYAYHPDLKFEQIDFPKCPY